MLCTSSCALLPQQRLRLTHVVLLGLLLVASGAHAQLTDVKGSKDPSMLKRYEGSTIIGYDFRKFDEFEVALGPLKAAEPGSANRVVPSKSQRVEGQATRILYTVPEGRSPLEVLRNYEQELQKSGFKTLYRCSQEQCGGDDGDLAEQYLYSIKKRLSNTPPPGTGKPPGQVSEYAFSSTRDQQFLTAMRAGFVGWQRADEGVGWSRGEPGPVSPVHCIGVRTASRSSTSRFSAIPISSP